LIRSTAIWASSALLLAPAIARAEPFHLANPDFNAQGAHADLVSDAEARTEPDGARSILVTKIILTPGDANDRRAAAASLDQTRLAFDCKAMTYKLMSETLIDGIDPRSPRTDKPPPAGQAGRPVEGGDLEGLQAFACTGPRSVKPPMLGFQQQNLWEAVAQTVDNLSRALSRAARSPGG
jgi:hypothetical protein